MAGRGTGMAGMVWDKGTGMEVSDTDTAERVEGRSRSGRPSGPLCG